MIILGALSPRSPTKSVEISRRSSSEILVERLYCFILIFFRAVIDNQYVGVIPDFVDKFGDHLMTIAVIIGDNGRPDRGTFQIIIITDLGDRDIEFVLHPID